MRGRFVAAPLLVLLAGCSAGPDSVDDRTSTAGSAISFMVDEAADRLIVTTATSDADWHRVTVMIEQCAQTSRGGAIGRMGQGVSPFPNEAANPSGAALNEANRQGSTCGPGNKIEVSSVSEDTILASEYIEFCGSPGGAAMTDILLVVVDADSEAVIAEPRFTNWADC